MALFRLSFSQKVQLYACTVSLVSLLLAGIAFISFDIKQARLELEKSLQLKVDLISHYAGSAIAADNPEKINDILQYFRKNSEIAGVWVYSISGKQIMVYNPKKIPESELPVLVNNQNVIFMKDYVKIIGDINYQQRPVGKVVLMASLNETKYRTSYLIMVGAMILMFSLLGAVIVTFRLQRILTKSLYNLLQTVKTITQTKDYSVRAQTLSQDDLGSLTEGINSMLQEVEQRDVAITKSEERLNLALWGSNEVMFDWDVLNDFWYFDESFENLLGYQRDEIPSNRENYFKLVYQEDIPIVLSALKHHMTDENHFFVVEHRLLHKQGHWCWILARAKIVERNKHGRALRMAGTLLDITTKRETQQRLELFNKVFESTTEGVIVTDPDFNIIEINPSFTEITGFSRQDIIGQSINILHSDKQNEDFYRRMHLSLQAKGKWQGELWEKRQNGEVYPQRLTINAMLNDNKQIIHYVAVFSDITQFKQTEDELQYLTNYDALTSLPNRSLMMTQLDLEIKKANANKRRLALVMVGLDNFKVLNDSYGHEIGDVILQSVATRLCRCVKKKDLVSRITGDEFALIIQNVTDFTQLREEVQNILLTITAHFFNIEGHDILLGASAGVSLYPDDAQDLQTLFTNADTALYHAKQTERNSYQLYVPQMNDQVLAKQRMEVLLRGALTNNELYLDYQPKIDAKSGLICGVEALLRWKNPELGLVPSNVFIPLAEELGVIVTVGRWVLKTACAQTKKWHDLGFGHLKISVNLSAYQFRTGDLVKETARILMETHLPPKSLDLELTEGVLIDNIDRCVLRLKVLKAMGITISIDDFGTGYSSLSYLRRFPIDALKIDQSFVKHVCENQEDASIVNAIVAMAKGLKIRTVAEGVETKEQVDYLMAQQIDELQGYYYSRPLNAEQMTERLTQETAKVIAFK
jgi:diguanylate cyclase (GGDEF)-like protein/PAS domain S-box-containing protein